MKTVIPLQQSRFRLALSADQVTMFYSGAKHRVQVTDDSGKILNIPWSALVPHVTPVGVRGNFIIYYGAGGQLSALHRVG